MIHTLDLINFKAFDEESIQLNNFTLLSGLNSSGKSTVLQALGLLRQAYDSHGRIQEQGEPASHRIPLNGGYVDLGTGQDVLHEDFVGESPRIGFRLGIDDGSSAELFACYESEADALPVSEETFATPAWNSDRLSLTQPGFQFLRADRINPATTYTRSYEMSGRRGFLGTRGEYTIDFLRQRQDDLVAAAMHHPHAESTRLLDQVEAWLGEICPGVRVSANAIDQTDLVRLGFQFTSPGRAVSSARRPTNVGFGLTYVLPVVVACLTGRPGGMLLIENPEAHVHPRGQSAMARLACSAASAGSQVILETHSDHVLNGTRLAVKHEQLNPDQVTLHYFNRPNGGRVTITTPTVGPDGMLSTWPDGFFDEWDTTLDRLLE